MAPQVSKNKWRGFDRLGRKFPDDAKYITAIAVSILIIAMDNSNKQLEGSLVVFSLSDCTRTQKQFHLWQYQSCFYTIPGRFAVSLQTYRKRIVAGYIRSKMTAGLSLPGSLMLEPVFIAKAVVNAGKRFTMVPGLKWKIIYNILRILPESLVASCLSAMLLIS